MKHKTNLFPVVIKFAIVTLYLSMLLGCSESAPPTFAPTFVSTSTSMPVPSFTATLTQTTTPSITPTPFIDIRQKLAPDTYVVFWSQDTWYIRGVNGFENIQLIPNISSEINTILELSPDGNQVAFSNAPGQLSIYDLRTGSLKSYANSEVNGIYDIIWLADGKSLLYSGNLGDTQLPDDPIGIYGISLDTNALFNVVNRGREQFEYGLYGITLSKDGKWLAFHAPHLSTIWEPDPEYIIYLMDMNCLEIPETCNESLQYIGDGTSPAWSPDGKLGWDCSSEIKSMLCFMDVNKPAEPQVLLDISKITLDPEINFRSFSWSPNGRYIAVNLVTPRENNIANNVTIYVAIISSDGKQVIEVTSHSETESYWEGWSPDSRYLAYSNFLGYTEPYGEVGVRSPMKYIYLYDIQGGVKIDLVNISSDREVFNFFFEIK